MNLKDYKLLDINEETGDLTVELLLSDDTSETVTIHYAQTYHDILEDVLDEEGKFIGVKPVKVLKPLIDLSSKETFERDLIIFANSYLKGKELEGRVANQEVKDLIGG